MAHPFPGTNLQLNSMGDAVKQIQQRLSVQQTGLFGPTTQNCVKAFQAANGLGDDGIVGQKTWDALFAAPVLDDMAYPGTVLRRGSEGENVKLIQKRLSVQQTGVFGPTTEECVSVFQATVGLGADGEVGPDTWKALFSKTAEQGDLSGRALEIAQGLVGVREHPLGSNRGPEVNQYLREAGVDPGNPWCMAFVYHCVKKAAQDMGVANPMSDMENKASCSSAFRWAKKHGKLVSRPMPGDIFLCIGGETGHFHTGFVAGPVTGSENRYVTIEGNSNDDGSANGIAVVKRSPGRRVTSCHYVRV